MLFTVRREKDLNTLQLCTASTVHECVCNKPVIALTLPRVVPSPRDSATMKDDEVFTNKIYIKPTYSNVYLHCYAQLVVLFAAGLWW